MRNHALRAALALLATLGLAGTAEAAAPPPRVKIAAGVPGVSVHARNGGHATVVLQLVARGKLSSTHSVDRHLPGLVPGGSAITIRQLLGHTSGLRTTSATLGFSRRTQRAT
jgi:hypothetical protein